MWNYSATSHGKGAVDGLGGTIKRMATNEVKNRKAIMKDAQTLVEAVSDKTKIHLILLNETDITSRRAETKVDELWNDVPGVPGTLHVHCVEPHENGIVTRMISNDDAYTTHSFTDNTVLPQKVDQPPKSKFFVADYVIVKYEQGYFPGEIIKVTDDSAEVKAMVPSGPLEVAR